MQQCIYAWKTDTTTKLQHKNNHIYVAPKMSQKASNHFVRKLNIAECTERHQRQKARWNMKPVICYYTTSVVFVNDD